MPNKVVGITGITKELALSHLVRENAFTASPLHYIYMFIFICVVSTFRVPILTCIQGQRAAHPY